MRRAGGNQNDGRFVEDVLLALLAELYGDFRIEFQDVFRIAGRLENHQLVIRVDDGAVQRHVAGIYDEPEGENGRSPPCL